jgi:bifunctional non-homologous end joining protein LigD
MLEDYKTKRDFKRTPEPALNGKVARQGQLRFVIQKHSARQLHYDFRLEVDGVLKSWAVSKGMSYDPAIKRLAVMVEDHPLDYAAFEGVIPDGQYGAGQVIVWDRGTYSPDENNDLSFGDRLQSEDRMRAGLASGKLSITLRGEKLKGSWTLVRMQRSDKNWLLIKHHDEYADSHLDILKEETSVISGLTINDLKTGYPLPPVVPKANLPSDITGAAKSPFPTKLEPMLASLAAFPFSGKEWLFEPKLDGFRTLAFLDNGKVWLQSRGGLNVTKNYPILAESIKNQPSSQLVLDGEIIALDTKGNPCFQCLQRYLKTANSTQNDQNETPAIIYYVFDILYLDGYDLKGVPLKQRKSSLHSVLVPDQSVRLIEHFPDDGQSVYRAAIANGFEGVVAKRWDSFWEPGKRSKNWLKVKKVKSDEFVIGGFTRGTGNRAKTFGALVLGYYDDATNFRFAGNVGTGFDNDSLLKLRQELDPIRIKESPFHSEPEQVAGVTWVKPELVVEVKFAEWTQEGRLRAPVFLREREDKPANTIHPAMVIETPTKPSKTTFKENSETLKDILIQLESQKNDLIVETEGYRIPLSNLDKQLWPEVEGSRALTKRDLITYLVKVSTWLLPHLKDRPLTLSRYPNGIHGQHFFQRHYKPSPDFVATAILSTQDSPKQEYLLCNNLSTLLWLGQIAGLELHTWFSRVKAGDDFEAKASGSAEPDYYSKYPDFLIFDLDPYVYSGKEIAGAEPELNNIAFRKACQVAMKLKEILDSLSFSSFVKTSGRTGLHIFVPILRELDFHSTHSAAETLSRFLMQKFPDLITIDWVVEKRAGKIFLDFNQNVRGKTLASIYSPRPSPEASVSIPLRWDELGKIYPTDFTILNVPERLTELGDLWANILEAKVDLVRLLSAIKPGK